MYAYNNNEFHVVPVSVGFLVIILTSIILIIFYVILCMCVLNMLQYFASDLIHIKIIYFTVKLLIKYSLTFQIIYSIFQKVGLVTCN